MYELVQLIDMRACVGNDIVVFSPQLKLSGVKILRWEEHMLAAMLTPFILTQRALVRFSKTSANPPLGMYDVSS
jgi:hypothetical protein